MRDYQSTISVEAVGDSFAVVRTERWRHDNPPAIATVISNKVLVDGPFHTKLEATAALARIDARAQRTGHLAATPAR